MGTNFYHRFNINEDGSEYLERHIGKRSGGWEFSFRGYNGHGGDPKIRSWADWKFHLLKEGKVFDEYGNEHTTPEFIAMVEKTIDLWADGMKQVVQAICDFMRIVVDMWTD